MSVKVITAQTYEPVTVIEARLWCRIDDDDTEEDATLLLLITAMREKAEELTGRAFASRTLELRLDEFPDADGAIELPFAPLREVTSISYLDSGGTLQSLDASPKWWQEDTNSEPGRVAPALAGSWPGTADALDAVRIRYTAGYANPNAIPRLVRLWMQSRISTLFDNRDQLVMNNTVHIPRDFADGLLDGLRVNKLFA